MVRTWNSHYPQWRRVPLFGVNVPYRLSSPTTHLIDPKIQLVRLRQWWSCDTNTFRLWIEALGHWGTGRWSGRQNGDNMWRLGTHIPNLQKFSVLEPLKWVGSVRSPWSCKMKDRGHRESENHPNSLDTRLIVSFGWLRKDSMDMWHSWFWGVGLLDYIRLILDSIC